MWFNVLQYSASTQLVTWLIVIYIIAVFAADLIKSSSTCWR